MSAWPARWLTPQSGRRAGGGDALGEHHPGEDAADEAGAGGDGDGVDGGEGEAGGGEGGAGDGVEALGVGAGGDLGDDAAVAGVQGVLAGDLGGEDGADGAAGDGAHQGDRGVVAAGLDPQDDALALHTASRLRRCCVRSGPQLPPGPAPRNGGLPRGGRMPARRTLLLTRPRQQGLAFAAEVEARLPGRFAAVIAPLIAVAPLPGPIDLQGVGGLVFTSANGVEQFAARSPERSLPAWCVGAMTAAAATAAGFEARAGDGDVGALAALVSATYRPGDGALLHVRGRHAAGDLLGRLAAAGIAARAVEIYDQVPAPLPRDARDLLARGGADVLAFFSPRTAGLFAAEAARAGWDLGRAAAVSLSTAADAGLGGLGLALRAVAPAPTRDGMIAALATLGSGRG